MINHIFDNIKIDILQQEYHGNYNKIEYNSLLIEEGDIFVALCGTARDGHDYIDSAAKRGAKMIIVSKHMDFSLPGTTIIKVNNTRKLLGRIAGNFYGHPQKKLKILGVTGTNGKTTTAYLLHNFLDKSAFIGSIGIEIGDQKYPSVNTTPESLDIIRYSKEALEAGMKYLVLEVSSQGIDNWRVEGLEFDGAVFTNLTKEHLDYHKSMEDYYSVKKRLFDQVKNGGIIVTSLEDPYGRKLKKNYPNAITYGYENADYTGSILNIALNSMSIDIDAKGMGHHLDTTLIGNYNLLNILASMALAENLSPGYPFDFQERLNKINFVEGRMQILEKGGIRVIIDYAHTEDALLKVLTSVKRCKSKRLLTLISGTGERYKEKRPVLGSIAAEFSDFVMISSNSPRSEDPMDIALEVAKGFEISNYKNFHIEVDREKAVEKLISMGEEGDIIILTGKGHERYQEINGVKQEYREVEVVKKVLGIE